MNDYQKAIAGKSTGYRIAKEFYSWIQLSKSGELARASSVVKLAEQIDKEFEQLLLERLEGLKNNQ